MKYLHNRAFLLPLAIFSPYAHAADLIPWKSYLAVVMIIALIAATFLSLGSKKAEGRVAKIIMAGVYFWIITFAELILLALIYHFFE